MSTNSKLTIAEEKFCIEFLKLGAGRRSATAAYLKAFQPSPNASDNTNWSMAYQVKNRPHVKRYIKELRDKLAETSETDVVWKACLLKNIALGAHQDKEWRAAVSAINELNKMCGHHAVVKVDNTTSHEVKVTEIKVPDNLRIRENEEVE